MELLRDTFTSWKTPLGNQHSYGVLMHLYFWTVLPGASGQLLENQGLHGSHCFGPRHVSCCSFDSGRCNDSHVKAGTSVVGSEVTKWRLELYNCHWATLPSNLGKWVPRDRQGQMHMWGWAYTALGIKGTTFPLKLVMISGVVLRPCVNNLLPNYLSCSDCSTI